MSTVVPSGRYDSLIGLGEQIAIQAGLTKRAKLMRPASDAESALVPSPAPAPGPAAGLARYKLPLILIAAVAAFFLLRRKG